ncbi:hypothetical protein AGABI2DRAFT_189397 [Agaricus bisporus var. bisporus H97]|uniref:hypothetical protein n=1 Tax=Agaricus bisporus var. bisporus (strain H97 / ATCC MYA-4626 / FGSC 10389) TaxID=936046 RepID=UPI00029F800F|nr:hypothetical protein AGABI2DRAFT_189397 [Agaricus bisporus var. bisporus H97]EKV51097.1 hypothetical protein AGABI2DRAFT_189397 [Agaricus bisporus var. bisporus H97]
MAVLSSPIQLIQSIPPVTRAFTFATILFSGFYAWLRYQGLDSTYAHWFLLIPGTSFFSPWTFLTSALVELSIFEFIATMIFVPASLKYLERLWGAVETIKFIVVTIVASNIIAFGLNWIEFMATGWSDQFLYGMQYHGQMALQIALLVAFTQLIPEHQVQIMGIFKARVKSLPMAYLTLSTVLCFLGWQDPWILIQFGWFVGWVYLRFYKKNHVETVGGVDTYGDRSETFSLISWFPPFMHRPLTLLGNLVFSLANRFHLIPTSAADLESGTYNQVPLSARAEAERRRALALKALDQRLANTSSPVGSTSTNTAPQAAHTQSVSQSRSDGASPSDGPTTNTNGRPHDREKHASEADGGENLTKSESQ